MSILEVEFQYPELFKGIINILKDSITEANIFFLKSQNGVPSIFISETDSTKNVLVELKMDGKYFVRYHANKNQIKIGINMILFSNVLRAVEKDDTLILRMLENKEDIIQILYPKKNKEIFTENKNKEENEENEGNEGNEKNGENEDHNKKNKKKNKNGKKTVKPVKKNNKKEEKIRMPKDELKLIELDINKLRVPKQDYDAIITIYSSEFVKICKNMSIAGSDVEIRCYDNNVSFTSFGDMLNREVIYEDDNSDERLVALTNNGSEDKIIKGKYDLKNFLSFIKCCGFCEYIWIHMINNNPLVIEYDLENIGKMKIMVGPVMDDVKNISGKDYYTDEEDDNY